MNDFLKSACCGFEAEAACLYAAACKATPEECLSYYKILAEILQCVDCLLKDFPNSACVEDSFEAVWWYKGLVSDLLYHHKMAETCNK